MDWKEIKDSFNTPIHCNLTTTEKIDKQFQIDEPNKHQTHLNLDENSFEEKLAVDTKRAADARHIAKMTSKFNACDELGDSKDLAIKHVFIKFKKDSKFTEISEQNS